MHQIICVKISQKQLPSDVTQPFHYFPYDRVYLVPPASRALIPRMFRVFMSMDLTPSLLKVLNMINFCAVTRNTIQRNWGAPEPRQVKDFFKGICDDPAGWQIIVPTFLYNEYEEKKGYTSATVHYVLSEAVTVSHNLQANMPPIKLHTPDRVFPLMCLACLSLPEQMAGKCTPGLAICRQKKDFKLPVDPRGCEQKPTSFQTKEEKSI